MDFNLPERFDLTYIGEDSAKHRPVMLHRAILGSIERFFGVLTEHYAGAFPMWLAPTQIAILPISDRHLPFARELAGNLASRNLRVEVDDENEKLGAKIRKARNLRIPAMAVIGDKELEARGVSLRTRTSGDMGFKSLDDLISWLEVEAKEPSLY